MNNSFNLRIYSFAGLIVFAYGAVPLPTPEKYLALFPRGFDKVVFESYHDYAFAA
jgi:hypothetical protein